MNVNIEFEGDDYYDKFIDESSPRTNYGDYETDNNNLSYNKINELRIRLDENESVLTMLKLHGSERVIFAVTERISRLKREIQTLENEKI
jgi:hypothetical protein